MKTSWLWIKVFSLCTVGMLMFCGMDLSEAEANSASILKGSRPNILVILSDDHGILDSGCYGNKICRTPDIDRLASGGLRFTRAFTATAMCTPSRSTLYTGLYPHRHGAHANHSKTRAGIKSMPHYLKPLDYRVGLAGKTHIKPREAYPFEYMKRDKIEEFIAENTNEHFCLIFATNDPHTPFKQPEPGKGHDHAKIKLPPYLVDTLLTRILFDNYYTSVEALDGQVGEVMRLLKRLRLIESTLVIYVSDHGAGVPFAKWTLYDAGLNVPFIVSWSGKIRAGVTDAMISFVDLLPTCIELAGGKVPDTIDGRSFIGIIEGTSQAHRDTVFGTHTTKGIIKGSHYPIRDVRTSTHKYIRNFNPDGTFENLITRGLPNKGKHSKKSQTNAVDRSSAIWPEWLKVAEVDSKAARRVELYRKRPAEELYDLRTDPFELNNLAADPKYKDVLNDLRIRLAKWMKQQGDLLVMNKVGDSITQ
ncbi:MAG: sulfatase [Planctomycetota bacterium]|nr:MAG: sulfatase [Planctomycetota bacterium]